METVKIIEWEDKYKKNFISLSMEWLKKYNLLEEEDLKIICHPYEAILNDRGNIFFAIQGDEILGTVAMINLKNNSFELAKLAVTEKAQGRGNGNLLVNTAINFAKQRQAQSIILYTNHKLIPAINLYKKFGFKEIQLENSKYLESDMKMVLKI